MEPDNQKTKMISFTPDQQHPFNHYVNHVSLLCSNCIKNLGVMLHSKLHVRCHVDYVHSRTLGTLGLIHYITNNLLFIDSLFYIML
jgi:hypothetical protein